jgi:type II secretory pathway pseudopilin PulG
MGVIKMVKSSRSVHLREKDLKASPVVAFEGLNHKKASAFTLAEVLITIGVIGVVAALALPVLSAHIKDVILQNQLKRAQAVLINGVKLLEAQDGGSNLNETTLMNCDDDECIKTEIRKGFKVVEEFDSDKLGKYTVDDRTDEDVWSNSDIIYKFVTMDGTHYGLKKFDKDATSLEFIADVNGAKNPNTSCQDLVTFTVTGNSIVKGCDFPKGCDIDNLSACNEEQCNALNARYPNGWGSCGARCKNAGCRWESFGDEGYCQGIIQFIPFVAY